jgi:hypothetical protein
LKKESLFVTNYAHMPKALKNSKNKKAPKEVSKEIKMVQAIDPIEVDPVLATDPVLAVETPDELSVEEAELEEESEEESDILGGGTSWDE